MEIILHNVKIQVGKAPNGMRVMQFVDPQSHITITVLLTPEAARTSGAALSSSLVIADGPLPPNRTTRPRASWRGTRSVRVRLPPR